MDNQGVRVSFKKAKQMPIKATCPANPEHKRFITTAHVMEEWIFDERGNFLELSHTLETTHKPNADNTWTCKECGEYAKLEIVPR